MKCFYHPDVDAVATCSNCGRAICQADVVEVAGRIVCQQCLATGKVSNIRAATPVKPTNTLAMVSIGVAVFGLITCFCFGVFGSAFGFIAAITGFLARKQILEAPESQEGLPLATIGMVLGICEAALGIIGFLCLGGIYGTEFLSMLLQDMQ
jgi:hypothetical protein